MWKRTNGAYVYLPGGPGGSADSPSDFYQGVKKTLQEIGLDEPNWTFKYNAGANPRHYPKLALAFQSAPIHPMIDFRLRMAGR
jgi:hypothetical protein